MSSSTAFKTLLLITCMVVLDKAHALAPVDPISTLTGALYNNINDPIMEALDVFDASQDIMEEIDGSGEGSNNTIASDVKVFNKELGSLKNDLREIGYTNEAIEDVADRFNSRTASISQKLRVLRRALQKLKGLRETLGRRFGKDPTLYQKGLLATQQQSLLLQIQQTQRQDQLLLEQKRQEVAAQKAIMRSFASTIHQLLEKKQAHKTQNLLPETFSLSPIQKAVNLSSFIVIIFGAIGLLIPSFRDEGILGLKAGFLGVSLSYFLPAIIFLYRGWLGI